MTTVPVTSSSWATPKRILTLGQGFGTHSVWESLSSWVNLSTSRCFKLWNHMKHRRTLGSPGVISGSPPETSFEAGGVSADGCSSWAKEYEYLWIVMSPTQILKVSKLETDILRCWTCKIHASPRCRRYKVQGLLQLGWIVGVAKHTWSFQAPPQQGSLFALPGYCCREFTQLLLCIVGWTCCLGEEGKDDICELCKSHSVLFDLHLPVRWDFCRWHSSNISRENDVGEKL